MMVSIHLLLYLESLFGASTAERRQVIEFPAPEIGHHSPPVIKRAVPPAYIDCKPQVFIHLGDLVRWAGVEYPTDAIVIKIEKAFPDVRSILFSPPTSTAFGTTPPPPNVLPVGLTLDVYLALRRNYCPDELLALYGYGHGAETIHKLINTRRDGKDVFDYDQVLAIILFSDPLFLPGKPWSRGTAVTGADVLHPSSPEASPLFASPWHTKTLSFCIQTDNSCAYPGRDLAIGQSKFSGSYLDSEDYVNEASELIITRFIEAEAMVLGN